MSINNRNFKYEKLVDLILSILYKQIIAVNEEYDEEISEELEKSFRMSFENLKEKIIYGSSLEETVKKFVDLKLEPTKKKNIINNISIEQEDLNEIIITKEYQEISGKLEDELDYIAIELIIISKILRDEWKRSNIKVFEDRVAKIQVEKMNLIEEKQNLKLEINNVSETLKNEIKKNSELINRFNKKDEEYKTIKVELQEEIKILNIKYQQVKKQEKESIERKEEEVTKKDKREIERLIKIANVLREKKECVEEDMSRKEKIIGSMREQKLTLQKKIEALEKALNYKNDEIVILKKEKVEKKEVEDVNIARYREMIENKDKEIESFKIKIKKMKDEKAKGSKILKDNIIELKRTLNDGTWREHIKELEREIKTFRSENLEIGKVEIDNTSGKTLMKNIWNILIELEEIKDVEKIRTRIQEINRKILLLEKISRTQNKENNINVIKEKISILMKEYGI